MVDKATQALSRHEKAKGDIEQLASALRKAGAVDLSDFGLCRSLLEILQVGFIPNVDASGNGHTILFYPGLETVDMRRIADVGKAEMKIVEQTQNGVDHKYQVST